MIEFFECVGPKVAKNMLDYVVLIGGLILVCFVVAFIGCLFSGAAAVCLPGLLAGLWEAAVVFVVLGAAILLVSVLLNGTACAIGGALDALNANGVSTVTSALKPTTCEDAQAALSRAQQALAAASAAQSAQRERTDRAGGRVQAAAAGLVLSLVALVAVPFWRLDLLPGAIAAAVAAAALVVQRTRRLAAEVSALVLAEKAVVQAVAAVAAASALVAALCSARSGTTTSLPTSGDSVNWPGGIATASTLKG